MLTHSERHLSRHKTFHSLTAPTQSRTGWNCRPGSHIDDRGSPSSRNSRSTTPSDCQATRCVSFGPWRLRTRTPCNRHESGRGICPVRAGTETVRRGRRVIDNSSASKAVEPLWNSPNTPRCVILARRLIGGASSSRSSWHQFLCDEGTDSRASFGFQ